MKWIKVQEYAKKYNITNMAVYKKIKNKTLRTKKIRNITHVADKDNEQESDSDNYLTEQQEKINLEWNQIKNEDKKLKNDLVKEKLKNLQQDTILKKIRQQTIKQNYRKQFAEGVFDCFTESFGDLKSFFIQLKLDKEENAKLKQIFKKAIKKFENKLVEYIEIKDKEETEDKDETAS